MDDYHLFWMLSVLGGKLCALCAAGPEKRMAVLKCRFSGKAGLSGLLFDPAYDEHKAGDHRQFHMGYTHAVSVSGGCGG